MGLIAGLNELTTAQILVKAIEECQKETGKIEAELRLRAIIAEQRVQWLEQELAEMRQQGADNGE